MGGDWINSEPFPSQFSSQTPSERQVQVLPRGCLTYSASTTRAQKRASFSLARRPRAWCPPCLALRAGRAQPPVLSGPRVGLPCTRHVVCACVRACATEPRLSGGRGPAPRLPAAQRRRWRHCECSAAVSWPRRGRPPSRSRGGRLAAEGLLGRAALGREQRSQPRCFCNCAVRSGRAGGRAAEQRPLKPTPRRWLRAAFHPRSSPVATVNYLCRDSLSRLSGEVPASLWGEPAPAVVL